MSDCGSGNTSIACWISNQADILTNIANNLGPVEKLITGAAYLMGIMFAFKALLSLKQHGENKMSSQNAGFKEPLLYMLVAAVFLYFPTALSVMMDTTFGYTNILAYSSLQTNNPTLNTLFGSGSPAGRALSTIIQTIGLIAFIRGWIMITRSSTQGQQPGGMSKGIMHVVGGVLAMNIVGTLQVLNDTLYGN
jgi:intracellular multiplication protein IcmC